ncbi:NAD(P)H-binding protein [Catenuloplanes japonicus]|uniref:NAD(P)H-binding protein n=1 Tax=Catenuloplanes japonicus TaxID=33876 RepID=UPI00052640C0|nr:NAD(P)H-binding protein [Catenuloplanes japonicus]
MRIGVTGASGALARAAIGVLTAAGHEVTALSRTPADGERRADFDEPEGLGAAFAGLDRVLLVSTDAWDPRRRVRQHVAAIDAARASGVRHLVYTSLTGCDGPPEMLNAAHRATEAHLRAAGPGWTILRSGIYAEGVESMIAEARTTRRYVTNSGDGAVAFVRRDDCAAAAAAVVSAEDVPDGQVLDVTGPEALDADALAALAGPDVTVERLSDDAYRAHLSGPAADALVEFGRAIRDGRYGTVTTTVESLTGRPARRVRMY